MKRKWEWLGDEAKRKNIGGLEKLCQTIDDSLVKHYGNEHTRDWEDDYERIKTEYDGYTEQEQIQTMDSFMSAYTTCIACEKVFGGQSPMIKVCKDKCPAVKEIGACGEIKSLYTQACHLLDEYNDELRVVEQ